MEPPTSVESDLDFLRSVDEAELEALSVLSSKSKRQRVTLSQEDEGAYTSALKGSHSTQWKENNRRYKSTDGRDSSIRSEGRCFKCGEMGHWARECPTTGKANGPIGSVTGEEEVEPYKECPCGAGRCSVLTSNTTKNPGRRFFRCPVRSDMGGCDFFEWCDTPQNLAHTGPTNQVKSAVNALPCPCGVGPCQILTTKNGHNAGRQFYQCPVSLGGGSCGFFKCVRLIKPVSQHKSSPSLSYTASPVTRAVRFLVEGEAALPVSDVGEKVTGPGIAPTKPLIRTQIEPANLSLHMGRVQVQVLRSGLVQVLAHASCVARLVTGHMIVLAKVMVSENDCTHARPQYIMCTL